MVETCADNGLSAGTREHVLQIEHVGSICHA